MQVRILRNSLSDFVLMQSKDDRKLTWWNGDKEMPRLFSRCVQSLPAGGRAKSIAIDKDKWLRRKRRSKLHPHMDTWLSFIKKKSIMCIPSWCLREESRNGRSTIASVAVNPRTLSSISEIDEQISTRCLRSNKVIYVDTKIKNTDNCWTTDLEFNVYMYVFRKALKSKRVKMNVWIFLILIL